MSQITQAGASNVCGDDPGTNIDCEFKNVQHSAPPHFMSRCEAQIRRKPAVLLGSEVHGYGDCSSSRVSKVRLWNQHAETSSDNGTLISSCSATYMLGWGYRCIGAPGAR